MRYVKTTSVCQLATVSDCNGFPLRRACFVEICMVTTILYWGEKNKCCHSLYIFHLIRRGKSVQKMLIKL